MKKKRAAKDVYTLADLQNWPAATSDVDPPIRLGVFGDPVAQSLSPQLQNAAMRACQIDHQYARFHVLPDELQEALNLVRNLDFIGVNLTVPHKIKALEFVDQLDEGARRSGAINTISVEGKQLRGFDTDGSGFSHAIRDEFSVDLRDLRVLVLGAGGAARAIAWQCAREDCERLVIANRTLEKAKNLVGELHDFFVGPRVLGPVARLQAIPWEESAFRFQIANIDLIVNATPLGLSRGDASPIPSRLLAPHLIVYDTVYLAGRTPLTAAANEAGARSADGLSMLLHQGALAFETWFKREAPIGVMRGALGGS